jgi:hypothetical protein
MRAIFSATNQKLYISIPETGAVREVTDSTDLEDFLGEMPIFKNWRTKVKPPFDLGCVIAVRDDNKDFAEIFDELFLNTVLHKFDSVAAGTVLGRPMSEKTKASLKFSGYQFEMLYKIA